MDIKKLVSVIVPVYNCEKYLAACLDSVLSQTLKDIEIICVDDMSNFETKNIVNEYLCRDSRVKVIANESNQGAGYSRNIGLENATGKYVYFVDSDDLCDENMLRECYLYAERNKLDIVICDYLEYTEELEKDIPIVRQVPFCTRDKVFDCNHIPGSIFNVSTTATWNKLYRREFLMENHIRFSVLRNSEDVYFNSIALVLANRIGKLEDALLYKYRVIREGQLSCGLDKNIYESIKELIKIKQKLEAINKFDELRNSFENLFYDVMMYSLSHMSEENVEKLIDYYEKKVSFRVNHCLNIENVKSIIKEASCVKGYFLRHCEVMKQIRKQRFQQFLDAIKDSHVAIWGAALRGETLGKELQKRNICNIKYIDMDSAKWDKHICGYPISNVKSVSGWVEIIVVLNSQYTREICDASSAAIKRNVVIVELDTYISSFYEYNDCCIK